MYGPKRQTGLTAISWLILLMIGGFFVLLLLRLGPIYLEYYKVKSVLTAVKGEHERSTMTPAQVKETILNRFYINEVRRLSAKDVKLKQANDGTQVEVQYEVREHILGNVDALVSFNETLELKNR
jgi:hypothetical protein